MIGRVLAHYEVVGSLGKGGMGEVYVAEDRELQRRVALKVLPKDVAADPERQSRFEREARAEGTWHVHNSGWSPDSKSLVYTQDKDYGDTFELVERQ